MKDSSTALRSAQNDNKRSQGGKDECITRVKAAERDALSKQHSVLFVAKAGSGYACDPFTVQIAAAVGAGARELSKP